ncbi:MAG: FMN-binding protein [Oscillospiraceae bacterium]
MKKESLLKPIIVLVSICIVISAALAFANHITAPVIDAANKAKAEKAMAEVLPGGADFALVELEGLPAEVTEVDAAGNGKGYVFIVKSSGYGGEMSIILGIDPEGKITGTKVITHNETQNMGTKVVNDGTDYQKQLIGMSDTANIEAVSGATVSSDAMKNAVQTAFDAYASISDGTAKEATK